MNTPRKTQQADGSWLFEGDSLEFGESHFEHGLSGLPIRISGTISLVKSTMPEASGQKQLIEKTVHCPMIGGSDGAIMSHGEASCWLVDSKLVIYTYVRDVTRWTVEIKMAEDLPKGDR